MLSKETNISRLIDSTLLKADATIDDIEKLCKDAIDNQIYSVCVNPCYLEKANQFLVGSNVRICTVIGFPLGANTIPSKTQEIFNSIYYGIDEIDYVINLGRLSSNDYGYIEEEISAFDYVCSSFSNKIISKVIIETCFLNKESIQKICKIILKTNIDYVKTSTGFNGRGATIEDIKTIKNIVGDKKGIKASGGIGNYRTAINMIEAGATRIGTSKAVQIIREEYEIKEILLFLDSIEEQKKKYKNT